MNMMSHPAAFLPGVGGDDALTRHWLSQVSVRLRREVGWLWHERGAAGVDQDRGEPRRYSALPPFADRAGASLDLLRFAQDKASFFARDVTAQHLSGLLAAPPDDPPGDHARDAPSRGSFGWVAQHLALSPVECFVLALALLPAVDSTAGSVIATCLNDPARDEPTLGLAQRLWDEPDAVLRCFDPGHRLYRHGLVIPGSGGWQAALVVPTLVARELLLPGGELPEALQAVAPGPACSGQPGAVAEPARLSLVPVIGAPGAPLAAAASVHAAVRGRLLLRISPSLPREHLGAALTTAWLRGGDVFLMASQLATEGHESHEAALLAPPLPGLPLTAYVGANDRSDLRGLDSMLQSPITVPPLSFAERLACWMRVLPTAPHELQAELARRLRCEADTIERLGTPFNALVDAQFVTQQRLPDAAALLTQVMTAARADLDLGTLAQPVTPRFSLSDLMLSPPQARQVHEIVTAMHNLTRTHHHWGTALAWNEAGLSVLFAGPPGTGKTMAAEALARELALPMLRIDLSQVVNKYIGETEKNLRRLFDAADAADVILFFDEADALFGKRTEVKDAHDRYANLEVSYLLERMERFKGLAILATNRKKDLDEAFLRRLRFVVEFPLPGVEERRRIWQAVIPPGVDASSLDFAFLAQRFPLAGGHIRGIVFHACLQAAEVGAAKVLTMPQVIRAVQREYDKLDRSSSLDQFGPYASLVAADRDGK